MAPHGTAVSPVLRHTQPVVTDPRPVVIAASDNEVVVEPAEDRRRGDPPPVLGVAAAVGNDDPPAYADIGPSADVDADTASDPGIESNDPSADPGGLEAVSTGRSRGRGDCGAG